ncbi:MAG: thiamine pyrophosphate-dependent enzyme [Deltaproteobacteria bacterium]|jgi:phosphonopyruvate decarboxylase|nr:thiamine pyrophosphate-dependent enzyme [Deltaproteobacteria bacterium]MDZ4345113.1 thiamine pyrophosphate-dependent enzyme [Candidatus Binatia bacterium]
MKRYDCLKIIVDHLSDELVLANVGGPRHEWRDLTDHAILPVSALGLCSSMGLGLALALPHRKVLVLDGDGSVLINLNHFITAAVHPTPNLTHIIFDNGCYESSRAYPTNTSRGQASLAQIARASGIPHASEVSSLDAFTSDYQAALGHRGPTVIVAKVEFNPNFPQGVPMRPPAMDPIEYTIQFARHIEKTENIVVRKSPRHVFQQLRW